MKIREFRVEDYPVILELWKNAGLIMRPGDELEGIKLKLQRDPDLFMVACEGNEILGSSMVAWDGRRGWIYHLAVKPEQQRKGIAIALIEQVEKKLTERGAQKVNAQVYKWNQRSLEFFKAAGYETNQDLVMIGKHLRK